MNIANIGSSELLAILDVTRRLAEQHMVQPLVEYVATTVFDLIHAERCLVVFFVDGDEAPQVQVARTRQGTPLTAIDEQMSHSILNQVRSELAPVLVNDALDDSLLKTARSVRSLGLRSVICVPLISHGVAIGAIYAENRTAGGQFHESNLVPLSLFANQVVVALESARIVEALETTVAERTRALQEANQRLGQQAAELQEKNTLQEQLIEEHSNALATQQRLLNVIADLSAPVLPLLPDVLALPMVGSLDSNRMQRMHEQLLQSISTTHARVVLLDITGVPVVDTQVAAALLDLARAARLLGCQVIMVGIRPEIAQSLVGLGVSFEEITTRATLAAGLTAALRMTGHAIVSTQLSNA
jgi:anti-anti-sigma regulatory factor